MSISRGNCTNNMCDMLRFPSAPFSSCLSFVVANDEIQVVHQEVSDRRGVKFPAFCEWEHPWSRVNRWHLLFSCPFMFRLYVSKIQVFENWYAQTGQVGIRPNARVFLNMLWLFLLSFSYRFGGLCRLPSSGLINTCISSLFFYIFLFYSYRFLGRQCIGSVKAQAKLKWNARGYYTIPSCFANLQYFRHTVSY